MLRIEAGKWFRKLFVKGANSDIDPNMLGEGLFTDALNMRSSSIDGNTGSLKKIGGENITYTGTEPGAATYICIGSVSVNGHLVEYWANSNPVFPPLVRVDGTTSAMHADIPYTWDHPLKFAVVEQCRPAGVIYPVDGNSDPLFWDVQQLIINNPLNLNTQVFFTGFNINLLGVGLNAPPILFWLNKKEPLIDLGGSIGMPVGGYAYSGRWVTTNGDRTNWGPETPLIPIPSNYDPNDNLPTSVYPGGRTIGSEANILAPTQYGIHLNYRVDNQFGYASLEIKRRKFQNGVGPPDAGIEEICARIPVVVNDVSIHTYVDPQDANIVAEEIPIAEVDQQLLNIHDPGVVEYANQRLIYGDVKLDTQPLSLNFLSVGLRKMTAITKKLVKLVSFVETPDGYDNPYNSTYFKSVPRGERVKYGVQLWNGAQGKFYAITVPEPYQAGTDEMLYPNRGDIKGVDGNWGAESETFSDDPIYGANVTLRDAGPGPVTPTFEVTTQGTRAKRDTESAINVSVNTGDFTPGSGVVREFSQFNQYGFTLPPGFTHYTSFPLDVVYPNTGGYEPWKPRFNQDPEDTYDVPPNTSRLTGGAGTAQFVDQCYASFPENNLGKIFAPTYHALGGLLGGIDNVPESASCISIGRTAPSGQFVMQGMGSYILLVNDDAPANKSTNALYVHFPDYAAGLEDQATIDDLLQNPGNWKVRMVAGRGFYNETYGYTGEHYDNGDPDVPWCGECTGAHLMDMVSYARIQRDSSTTGVNVGEIAPGGMAYNPIVGSPAPFDNYVGIDKWRRRGPMIGTGNGPDYSFWQQGGQDGNSLLDINSVSVVQDGRSNYFRIQFNQSIYAPGADTVAFDTVFGGFKPPDFHGPFLVLNLIRENATVPEANSTLFIQTDQNIATNTCVGIYAGPGEERFDLLGEREHYDCISFLPTDLRYIYVLEPTNGERRYIYLSPGVNLPVVLADIAANGFWVAPDGLPVYGVYSDNTDIDGIQYLRVGLFGTDPESGSRIQVKYDYNAPFRVFGGDTTIAPSIHAVYDRNATRQPDGSISGNPVNINGLPLPYAGFGYNPRVFLPARGNQTEEQILINYLISIRQWCVVWDVESKIQPAYFVNTNSTPGNRQDQRQFFPAMHYIIRPYADVNYGSGALNGFFGAYDSDYPDEGAIFDAGGLRFLPAVNLDYAKQPDPEFVGLPVAGYVPVTEHCNWLCASNVFALTQQDVPNLRTFSINNVHPVSEETGGLKMIASATAETIGQNIYFWTQKGHGYVLTNKRTLNSVSGELIGTQSLDGYWGDEVFLSRAVGMPDRLWRLFAKGAAPVGESLLDTFFWADRDEVYRMTAGGRAMPIGRDKWLRKILPDLSSIQSEFQQNITAVYDYTKQEYLIAVIPNGTVLFPPRKPYVFSAKRNEWGGEYGHAFDRYVVHNSVLYGHRALVTTALDGAGFIQGGVTMNAFGEAVFVPNPGIRQEAQAFRFHPSKPTHVEIYDKDHNLVFFTDQATQEAYEPGTGADWILKVDGYEALAGRKNVSIDPDQDRIQDEVFYLRAYFENQERSVLTDAQLQLQQLI